MKDFYPYITFDGTCEEALEFYCDCFAGEIVFIQHYEDHVKSTLAGPKARVMHSEFRSGPVHFMACDKSPGQAIHYGTNITLYLGFTNTEMQDRIFMKLADKGIIHMPLEGTFWGSRLGILTDQFGIHWMLVLNRD